MEVIDETLHRGNAGVGYATLRDIGDGEIRDTRGLGDLGPLPPRFLKTALYVVENGLGHGANLGAYAYTVKALMHREAKYYAAMPKTLRDVLGENVKAVMKARGLKQPAVAAAAAKAGKKINQTTVSRVANAVYPATVDTIEALAKGMGVQAWQLLIPGLDPDKLPTAPPIVGAEVTEKDRQEVTRVTEMIYSLSAPQRDLFVQEGLVPYLLNMPHYPVEKMPPGWDASAKRQKQRGE